MKEGDYEEDILLEEDDEDDSTQDGLSFSQSKIPKILTEDDIRKLKNQKYVKVSASTNIDNDPKSLFSSS